MKSERIAHRESGRQFGLSVGAERLVLVTSQGGHQVVCVYVSLEEQEIATSSGPVAELAAA